MHTKISEQGNIIEVTTVSYRGSGIGIKKINADEYVNLETGEILPFENRAESRADTVKSLYRTFARLRAIVNTNCTDPEKLRWITLTYAENMRDRERLYHDFHDFWLRFKRRWGKAEYIVVAEPQGRGAWHMHLIAIFPDRAPYIENSKLRECWGFGFVRVTDVKSKNVDNLGAYLSAYLGDVEVGMDSKEGEVKVVDGVEKKFLKGGRLSLYPAGMNIYRCSRGIKKPDEWWVESQTDIEEVVGDAMQTYKKEFEFQTEEGFRQIVRKEFYNKIRKRGVNEC